MTKVTYLFGAGASHPTLPVVGGFIPALQEFYNNINQNIQGRSSQTQKRFILQDLEQLINLVKPAYSIDTLAKTLTRNNTKQLKKLKDLLSIYFLYLQTVTPVNKRYDSFFATILPDPTRLKLPDTINIISWNYDLQFEVAYNRQSELNKLNELQKELRVFDKFCDPTTPGGFQIFKMNGSAGFNDSDGNTIDYLFADKVFLDLENLLDAYDFIANNDTKVKSSLSFAWEPGSVRFKNCLTTSIVDSDILVIIGYSFPDFNREHDILYMSELRNAKKVFIQDPNYENIKSKVMDILMDERYTDWSPLRPKNIFPVNSPDTSVFYIPQSWFPYSN